MTTTGPTTPAAEEAKAIEFTRDGLERVRLYAGHDLAKMPATAADLIAALQADDALRAEVLRGFAAEAIEAHTDVSSEHKSRLREKLAAAESRAQAAEEALVACEYDRAQAAEAALAKLRLDHAAQSYDLGKAQGEAEGATMQLGALTRERDDLKTKVNNQRRVLSGQAVQLEELKAEREGLRGEVELLDAVRAAANAAWVAFQESSPRQGIAMHELRIAMNRLDAQRAPIAKQAPAAEGPECNCDPEDTGPMMHMKDCPVRVAREAPAAEGREPKRHTSECQGYDPDCECNPAACRRAALPQVAQASADAPCDFCGHAQADHVSGHGCTARLEDKSECECGHYREASRTVGEDGKADCDENHCLVTDYPARDGMNNAGYRCQCAGCWPNWPNPEPPAPGEAVTHKQLAAAFTRLLAEHGPKMAREEAVSRAELIRVFGHAAKNCSGSSASVARHIRTMLDERTFEGSGDE